MKKSDFSFELPERLIARQPLPNRAESRLMVLNRKAGTRRHHVVRDLPALLPEGSLLVFNNSRVRKARLPAIDRGTGARTEFLLLHRLNETTWRALVRRAKRRRTGSRYDFTDGVSGEITGGAGEFRHIAFDRPIDDVWLDVHGRVPLPPYLGREDGADDSERYQTVYAERGNALRSAAAPTAGLHFSGELLAELAQKGFETVFITLHVGLGTFLPVRTEHIEDHAMHEESYTITGPAAERIEQAKAERRNITAIGTTSVRTLESAWENGALKRGDGTTSLFMYPGHAFRVTETLFTNFHTPESTLLMLVSAFAGREFIMESYGEAVREGYRFFSYGDAMLIQ
ncbi:MAG: tRNA preQ1(34) S-adenosylmethionine ribosyltransferase-isomerase QueA [Spirochaetaceae bacterium]|jgi:S-adenosylmethionine:tRNA ribosyltransferase-isomerase|nr:tRNA preQ1(34) S-adenosylmethionine ribosyltransferase-isomerase QueA [Spirochaetaceae bacterium]